jgi:phosphoribosyl 1,2-cyclic phosphodiesterase
MRLLTIASGSSGNSTYVGDDETHLLVDAGVSKKRIEEGLSSAELSAKDLSGILITHEHSDHIQSLGVLARKYGLPIYATAGTLDYIMHSSALGTIDPGLCRVIKADNELQIGTLTVHPFSIPHDAAEPVGFRISSQDTSVAVSTDIGHSSEYLIDNLKGLKAILIEANHDVRMLEAGPYPYYLKRRILSDVGHMSNETCGRLLCEVLNDAMKYVILGHLSKENNYPDLAYESVRCEIHEGRCGYEPDDFDIRVARRDMPGQVLTV